MNWNLWGPLLGGLGLLVLLALVAKVPLKYVARNIMVRWRTTLMTAMAFTLVVGLLTVMLAFVNGMYKVTEGSSQPGNVIVLSDGATDENFSTLGFDDSSDIGLQPGVLRDEQGTPLCSKEVYLIVNQPILDENGQRKKRRFVQVRGIENAPIAALVHNIKLAPGGTWFSDSGVQELSSQDGGSEQAIQAVLGEGLARILGDDQNKKSLELGDVFTLGDRKWIIVGIMQSLGSAYASEIWAKQSLIGPIFGKVTFSSLTIRTKDSTAAVAFTKFLKEDYKKAALNPMVEADYYKSLSATNEQFLYAIGFVAVFMGMGGMFGVMNTMFAAVSQRTKDIGVLRILGFSRAQVLLAFFLEGMALAILGGALGCALGLLADGATATSIVSSGQASKSVVLRLNVDANVLAVGMCLTLVMGVFGGLIPAMNALRLRPLEAMR